MTVDTIQPREKSRTGTTEYEKCDCPNCNADLREHSNEQLQQCAFNELSKINRKSTSFDLESKSQSNETPIAGGVTSG